MEPAKVYFSDLRADEISTLEKLHRLMKAAGFEQIDFAKSCECLISVHREARYCERSEQQPVLQDVRHNLHQAVAIFIKKMILYLYVNALCEHFSTGSLFYQMRRHIMNNYRMGTKCVQAGYKPGNGEPRQDPDYSVNNIQIRHQRGYGKAFRP